MVPSTHVVDGNSFSEYLHGLVVQLGVSGARVDVSEIYLHGYRAHIVLLCVLTDCSAARRKTVGRLGSTLFQDPATVSLDVLPGVPRSRR